MPTVPFASRATLESYSWCNRSYETDVNTWAEFGHDLGRARDVIGQELLTQADANGMIVVEAANPRDPDSGKCFWQLTAGGKDAAGFTEGPLFLMLMDPGALDPMDRNVTLRLGARFTTSAYRVFDQFGSQDTPIALLRRGEVSAAITVPAGAMRFLTLQKA